MQMEDFIIDEWKIFTQGDLKRFRYINGKLLGEIMVTEKAILYNIVKYHFSNNELICLFDFLKATIPDSKRSMKESKDLIDGLIVKFFSLKTFV